MDASIPNVDEMMSNLQAIERNNHALDLLKQGELFTPFQLLSQATYSLLVSSVSDIDETEHHERTHGEERELVYHFSWEDCGDVIPFSTQGRLLYTGSIFEDCETTTMPFVCLKFVRISLIIPEDGNCGDDEDVHINSLCPCGFNWVIWYNLSILCTAFGICVGERGVGRTLLQTAYGLLDHVYTRTLSPPTISKHWLKLQLAILNNLACIFQECTMFEHASHCLAELREKIRLANMDLEYLDLADFSLVLDILSRNNGGGAA